MSTIKERLSVIHQHINADITLVAVSKYFPISAIEEAYASGQRIFGESRVQELSPKQAVLPKDIQWHFIGHLQSNKVKYIAPYIDLIHAVDKESLLWEIERQAAKCVRKIKCLLQLHVAQENTKYGFAPEELECFLLKNDWRKLKNVEIVGLMCMASHTDNEMTIREEFRRANACFSRLKERFFSSNANFSIRSWGMSGDYLLAIEEGSNMIRIGSAIFAVD